MILQRDASLAAPIADSFTIYGSPDGLMPINLTNNTNDNSFASIKIPSKIVENESSQASTFTIITRRVSLE